MEALLEMLDFKQGIPHHFFVVVGGDASSTARSLKVTYDAAQLSHVVRVIDLASFGVDVADEVRSLAQETPVSDGPTFFILNVHTITSEAQNKLLKIFEEPRKNLFVMLFVQRKSILLPTLISRAYTLQLTAEPSKGDVFDVQKFIKEKNPSKRLTSIKILIDTYEEENSVLRSVTQGILDELESELAHDLKKHQKVLRAIYESKKILEHPSASIKMLLEHIALVLT